MGTLQAKRSTTVVSKGERDARKTYDLALSALVDNVRKLTPEDRRDFTELFGLLVQCDDDTEELEILATMQELVSAKPIVVSEETGIDEGHPEGLVNWMTFVAKKITELRKEARLTQTQLATKAGLRQSHISRLESAKHSATHFTLAKIAKALGVNVSKLDPMAALE